MVVVGGVLVNSMLAFSGDDPDVLEAGATVVREFNRRIKIQFAEKGIVIPRPQPMVMVERPPEPRSPDPDLAQAAQ